MQHLGVLFVALLVAPLAVAWRPWPPRNGTGEDVAGVGASKKFEGSSEFVKLEYHMGPVLAAVITVHPIWYGPWPVAQKRTIRAFLRSLSPSSEEEKAIPSPSVAAWWRTVRLYTDQTSANVSAVVTLGQEKSDARMSHGARLSRMDIQSVVRDAVTARTRPLPVDSGGVYLVLTSPEVLVENFCGTVCGFHYFTFPSVVGYTLPYAWVGNSARRCPEVCAYPFAIPSYVPGRRPESPPNGDVGVDGMVSVIAHELAEMASNPLANAWYAGTDPSFPTEIADLCEGIYGTGGGGAYTGQLLTDGRSGASYNVNGAGGRKFLVQWVWNPVVSYCSGPNALDQ
ncbi:protein EXORDIUM-like 3 [Phragmites australis]|uniref:protein EXORDIUM-like 3 n=1 Tax=Phragmites australis TaxID=29695 RepID=UPI002D79E26B|nr:protein EXORDIUM-like 3 [Phragmites australis]